MKEVKEWLADLRHAIEENPGMVGTPAFKVPHRNSNLHTAEGAYSLLLWIRGKLLVIWEDNFGECPDIAWRKLRDIAFYKAHELYNEGRRIMGKKLVKTGIKSNMSTSEFGKLLQSARKKTKTRIDQDQIWLPGIK